MGYDLIEEYLILCEYWDKYYEEVFNNGRYRRK